MYRCIDMALNDVDFFPNIPKEMVLCKSGCESSLHKKVCFSQQQLQPITTQYSALIFLDHVTLIVDKPSCKYQSANIKETKAAVDQEMANTQICTNVVFNISVECDTL